MAIAPWLCRRRADAPGALRAIVARSGWRDGGIGGSLNGFRRLSPGLRARARRTAKAARMVKSWHMCGERVSFIRKSPQLLDVARSYFPHLTSSTWLVCIYRPCACGELPCIECRSFRYEALAREPDGLRLDKDRQSRGTPTTPASPA